MSDTNNDTDDDGYGGESTENPFDVAAADKPVDELTVDDCYWERDEMDVLQDAYFILRDAGFTASDVRPLGELLNNTTMHSVVRTEMVFDEFVDKFNDEE